MVDLSGSEFKKAFAGCFAGRQKVVQWRKNVVQGKKERRFWFLVSRFWLSGTHWNLVQWGKNLVQPARTLGGGRNCGFGERVLEQRQWLDEAGATAPVGSFLEESAAAEVNGEEPHGFVPAFRAVQADEDFLFELVADFHKDWIFRNVGNGGEVFWVQLKAWCVGAR